METGSSLAVIKKIFNSENISITWRKAKSIGLLNIEAVEAGKIIYLLCAQLCKNTDSTIQSGSTNYSNSSCQTDLTNLQSCCHKSSDVHTSINEIQTGQKINCEAIQVISDSIVHITKAINISITRGC